MKAIEDRLWWHVYGGSVPLADDTFRFVYMVLGDSDRHPSKVEPKGTMPYKTGDELRMAIVPYLASFDYPPTDEELESLNG